jgi:HK97 family phage portal protein
MSNLKDIRTKTSKARQDAIQQKYLPDRSWSAFVWKNWKGYSRWDKQQVIEQGYNRNAAFYAAANIIAQTVSEAPIIIEYEKNGEKHTTHNHPIIDAMERNDSREELIEAITLYFVVTGEAYARIVMSNAGRRKRILGFIPLPSQYTTPVQGDEFSPISHFEVQNRTKETFMPEEMIYIKKPDLKKPLQGMSPGVPLAELIDLNNAGITWNKNVALSGGTPPIIASAPAGTTQEEAKENQDAFQNQSGADNAHRLKVLSGELNLHDLNVDPHDAEWGNAVLMSMRMILMTLNVSSSLMNDAANKTYNNVKDSRKALYIDAALPIADRIYKKISLSCRRHYDDNPVIRVDREAIEVLQEDMKSRSEWVGNTVDRGLMTRNEGREKLRLPRSNDPMADQLVISNSPSQREKRPGEVETDNEPVNNTEE